MTDSAALFISTDDEEATSILRDLVSTPFTISTKERKYPTFNNENNEELIHKQTFETSPKPNDCSDDKDNNALRLLDLHPGQVKFSTLGEKMEPVVIEGLENCTGILGIVEDKEVPWMSCDIIHNNDEDHFDDLKKKSNNIGKPISGAILWAHFALFVEGNTQPLGSSKLKGYPERIIIDEVLPGISAAAYWLRPGQRGQFLLPSHTMYGKQGDKSSEVPPNATILMLLHSLYWVDAGAVARYESLNYELRCDYNQIKILVENIHEVATVYHRQLRYNKAMTYFCKVVEILENCDIEPHRTVINAFKMRVSINLAICYLNLHKYEDAEKVLNDAIEFGDWQNNCKYLYTRGRCYATLHECDKALDYLIQALNIEPNNIAIGREIIKVEDELNKEILVEKMLCEKMFKNKDEKRDYIFKFDENTQLLDKFYSTLAEIKSIETFPIPTALIPEEIEMVTNSLKLMKNITFEKKQTDLGVFENYLTISHDREEVVL